MDDVTTLDATPQRPDGERVINASLTEIDLRKFIDELKTESTWKDSDRNSITVHKSDALVIVLVGLHDKAELKPYNVKGILSLHLLDGKIHLLTEQKNVELHKGNIIVLQENIFHSISAKEDSWILLTIAKGHIEKEGR